MQECLDVIFFFRFAFCHRLYCVVFYKYMFLTCQKRHEDLAVHHNDRKYDHIVREALRFVNRIADFGYDNTPEIAIHVVGHELEKSICVSCVAVRTHDRDGSDKIEKNDRDEKCWKDQQDQNI